MFSRAKFNATKLNVSASINEVALRAVFSEMLTARMGIGMELHVDSLAFSTMLSQIALGASAIPNGLALSEEMISAAKSHLAAPLDMLFSSELSASSIHIRANHSHTSQLNDRLAVSSAAGANIWLLAQYGDGISADAKIGAQIASESDFTEIFTVYPDASSQEEQSLLIKVTIPAGSELRINSENYTVTLDGENILHLQEGDWLMLDRDLCEITVDSGTGAELSGKMIWTERYL